VREPLGGHAEGMKTLSLAAAALATAVATLGLAGCGLGGSPSTNTNSQNARDRFVKYAQCMRQQGVDVPDRQAGSDKAVVAPGAGPDPKVEAANAICRIYAPNQEGEDVSAAEEDHALKTAECLRKHGINAKDPKPGTADITVGQGPGYTPEKLVAAYTTCDKEVPNPKPSNQ
jgi:hypothetical protein